MITYFLHITVNHHKDVVFQLNLL